MFTSSWWYGKSRVYMQADKYIQNSTGESYSLRRLLADVIDQGSASHSVCPVMVMSVVLTVVVVLVLLVALLLVALLVLVVEERELPTTNPG